jgi:hypothetical protein
MDNNPQDLQILHNTLHDLVLRVGCSQSSKGT